MCIDEMRSSSVCCLGASYTIRVGKVGIEVRSRPFGVYLVASHGHYHSARTQERTGRTAATSRECVAGVRMSFLSLSYDDTEANTFM